MSDPVYYASAGDLKTFIGDNHDFYVKKWDAAKNPDQFSGWNWSAFFGGMFWLGYRKMYLEMVGYFFISFCIYIIPIQTIPFSSQIINWIPGILLGLSGNTLYYHFATRNIKQVRLEQSTEDYEKEIKKKGGCSWVGVGIVVLIILTMIGILLYTAR